MQLTIILEKPMSFNELVEKMKEVSLIDTYHNSVDIDEQYKEIRIIDDVTTPHA